jgi:tRNA (guanine37-N1)-methyltransferase
MPHRVDIISLFPAELDAALNFGIVGRARERGLLELVLSNPRDFAVDAYKRVDERVFGGGPGMVFKLEPLVRALAHVRAQDARPASVVYLSPQGQTLSQPLVREFAQRERTILICGRYEGIDERFIARYVDAELSIGDYVLSGGEPAAIVLVDAVARLLPGALNKSESAEQDSFEDGLLDCPHYTRPEHAPEGAVPKVLLSGDHQAIARWRMQQSLGRTWQRRPDLLAKKSLSTQEQALLAAYQKELRLQEVENTVQDIP